MTYPSATTWRLFPTQLPSIVLGHLFVGLMLCGFAERPHYKEGVICAWWRGWVQERYKYSTTIGHGMCKASWFSNKTWFHERLHVWQYESLCTLGLVVGLALMPWIGWQGSLIVWATSGAPWLLPEFLVSFARFKRPDVSVMEAIYYLTEHERSAYSQTDKWILSQ